MFLQHSSKFCSSLSISKWLSTKVTRFVLFAIHSFKISVAISLFKTLELTMMIQEQLVNFVILSLKTQNAWKSMKKMYTEVCIMVLVVVLHIFRVLDFSRKAKKVDPFFAKNAKNAKKVSFSTYTYYLIYIEMTPLLSDE